MMVDLHRAHRLLEIGEVPEDLDRVSDFQFIAQLNHSHTEMAEIMGDFSELNIHRSGSILQFS